MLKQAQSNGAAAGMAALLVLHLGGWRGGSAGPDPSPGILVCNPPQGELLGEPDALEGLCADLGRWLKEGCSGWNL